MLRGRRLAAGAAAIVATALWLGSSSGCGNSGGDGGGAGGSSAGDGGAQCATSDDCTTTGDVCCKGSCTPAADCECTTHQECGELPDAALTDLEFVCCGAPAAGRCARVEDCSLAACPVGAGCSVIGSSCPGTNRVCEGVTSAGNLIDCTCQCQRGAAGAECDSSGGCSGAKSCNTGTCACECDTGVGAACDAFGGCSAGEVCNLGSCSCEPDPGVGGAAGNGGTAGNNTGGMAGVGGTATGGAGGASGAAGGMSGAAGASTGGTGGSGAGGMSSGGVSAGGMSGAAGTSGASGTGGGPPTGGEGSPCMTVADCNATICVGDSPSHVYDQVCQGGTCRRGARLETCDETCVGNTVSSQVCVAGACQPDATVEDCDTVAPAGCNACVEKNPARCELQGINGGWGNWRPSTPADDPVKNGDCSTANDGRVWHVHYCDNPPPSCGGIWCYWTTGAPGGPSSTTDPEFSCR